MGLRVSEPSMACRTFLGCIILFWMPCLLLIVAQNPSDGNMLMSMKGSLGSDDNLLLSTWNESTPLCQWRGIQWISQNGTPLNCNASLVRTNLTLYRDPTIFAYSIILPAAGLTGSIPKEMAKLTSLQKLYLDVNMLTGPIPLEIGNSISLAFLSLSKNQLNGTIPPSIWNLCGNLVELVLDQNDLGGSIPDPALPNATCPKLQKLDFGHNLLEGSVPTFLSQFRSLQDLDLSNNSLSGTIPEALANMSLTALNLAYNNLTGPIPSFSQNFSQNDFVGNSPSLCGNPLQACAGGQSPNQGGGHHSRLSPGAVAGIVIGVMAAMVVAVSVLIALGTSHDRKIKGEIITEFEEEETGEGRLVLFEGGEHLTVDDVLNATGQVLSKTSYGTLYKAKLVQGGTIVLRLLREGTARDLDSFLPAINDFGRLRHENLVPLRAYYDGQRGEKLLAYDYIPKGSLADLLHSSGRQILNWARRLKIALGAARGLAHLHTGLETPIIHGNLKSRNVLVDEYYVAHLTDYGLDRLMSPSAAAEMMEAASLEGYKAPELQKMKRANTKTDIYSFGILFLEILMGKKPGTNASVTNEIVDLPSIVKDAVLEERTTQVFDPEILKGLRSPAEDGLIQALRLAMGCCAPSPHARPDIKEVIRQLEEIRPKLHSPLYTPRIPCCSHPDYEKIDVCHHSFSFGWFLTFCPPDTFKGLNDSSWHIEMGCSTSRLENEEVVMLCKERKKFIKQAVDQRYALATAHVCYIHSLKNIGIALKNFAEGENIELVDEQDYSGSSPILTLPTPATTEPIALPDKGSAATLPPPSPSQTPPESPSQQNESPSGSSTAPDNRPSSPHFYESPHYLRSVGNRSMSYEEKLFSSDSIRMDSYIHPRYGMTDYFGSNMPPQVPIGPYVNGRATRDPDYPPPPPSPPRNFAWDFFNPFASLEDPFAFQEQKRISRTSDDDLKQVREEEGIPDLEEDDHREVDSEEEDTRELQVEEQTVEANASAGNSSHSEEEPETVRASLGDKGADEDKEGEKLHIIDTKESDEVINELKVEVIKSVSNEVISEKTDLAVLDSNRVRNLFDVMRDIEDQFIRAYDSGKEVARMLEANKVHYQSSLTEIKEHSAKVLNAITWHRSSSSSSPLSKSHFTSTSKDPTDDNGGDLFDDGGMISGSHASTLERLYAWEKKLYDEVKAGERTRIIYERKCIQLRNQDAKGDDSHTVDKTRAAIKDLHTRIRVAIQAIDLVSKRIQKLRDEELQPQLAELLQGLMRMWEVMLESHQTQNQIIAEAKSVGSSVGGRISSESHRQATLHLENELQRWHTSFSNWISAQKAYVEALNGWLLKCIIQEPEGSLKGRVSFSPRRVGAPPLFSICKDWVPAFDKLPEKAVAHAIRSFAVDIRTLWSQQDDEQRQKRKADNFAKALDKRIASLQRIEVRLIDPHLSLNEKHELDQDSAISADKRMSIDSFRKKVEEEKVKHHKAMQHTHHQTLNTLQTGLTFIFEALTDFAEGSLTTYKELYTYSERPKLTYENGGMPHKDG